MKSYLLLFLFSLTTLTVLGQSLSVTYMDTLVNGGFNQGTVDGYVRVKNISSNPVDVKVIRKTNNLATDHVSNFCWSVSCYAFFVDISSDIVSLGPNDVDNTFKNTISPNGKAGVSKVTYCFVNANNFSDSVCVTLTTNISATASANQLFTDGKRQVSEFSPNPATQFTRLNYQFLNGDVAKLDVFNMLGSKVMTLPLSTATNEVELNTSNFKPGLYIYQLTLNGKSYPGKKLIVKP